MAALIAAAKLTKMALCEAADDHRRYGMHCRAWRGWKVGKGEYLAANRRRALNNDIIIMHLER